MTRILAISLLLSVLFLPDIVISRLVEARPEDILILLAFVHLTYRKVLFNTFYSWVLLLMLVIFFMSIGLNDRLFSINSFEFYNKIMKGLVCYTIFLLFMQDAENYQLIIRLLLISLIIYLVGNFLQLLRVPFILVLLAKYSSTGQIEAMEKAVNFGRLPRLTGFIGNPNNNAAFFGCMTGLIIDLFFIKRQRGYLLLLGVIITAVVFTQSRTMAIAMLLMLLIVAVINKQLIWVIWCTLIILIIKYLAHIPYLDLLFDTNKLFQTHSVTGRLEEWANLITMIKKQPWLGFGGYKEYFYVTQTYPENEYLLAWFRYGVIYLIIFCGMMMISLILGIVSVHRKIFGGYFMLMANLTLLISSISNTPFNNERILVIYSLIQAVFSASLLHSPTGLFDGVSCDRPFSN